MPDIVEGASDRVSISLHRDEALILLVYLSREIWNADGKRLSASYEHPTEQLALEGLLQELAAPADGPMVCSQDLLEAARFNLSRRFA